MRRGDVFRLRLGRRHGHEQSGVRYGVIVPSDALVRRSTVLVAPTSTVAHQASFRPEIEIDGDVRRVLVEQTGAIDVTRPDHQHRRLRGNHRHAHHGNPDPHVPCVLRNTQRGYASRCGACRSPQQRTTRPDVTPSNR